MIIFKQNLFIIILLCFFTPAVISSCSLLDTTPAKVPAYLYVQKLGFTTMNTGTVVQGDPSSKFVDVWMYDNGNALGNIGLPAIIPDPKNGLTEIEFDAGIMKSGQDEDRVPYPFTSRVTFPNTLLSPNKTDTFNPVFKYLPETRFEINEGFETLGSSMAFSYDTAHNTKGVIISKVKDSINLIPSIVLGKYSGKIVMPSNSQFRILSSEFLKETLEPSLGTPVYLEIDYKSDLPIDIEMWAFDQNGSNLIQLPQLLTNPTSYWNKVYICLDQDIINKNPGTLFQITISLYNGSDVNQTTFLDNIKLVHF